MYDITNSKVKQKNAKSSDIQLSDVTNGPLPRVCPSTALIGLSTDPTSSMNQINVINYSSQVKIDLEESTGITLDAKSGFLYAIKDFGERRALRKGNQKIITVCASKTMDAVTISDNNVNLNCLTSGPSGLYAIDSKSGGFGKIDIKTGKFNRIGDVSFEFSLNYICNFCCYSHILIHKIE